MESQRWSCGEARVLESMESCGRVCSIIHECLTGWEISLKPQPQHTLNLTTKHSLSVLCFLVHLLALASYVLFQYACEKDHISANRMQARCLILLLKSSTHILNPRHKRFFEAYFWNTSLFLIMCWIQDHLNKLVEYKTYNKNKYKSIFADMLLSPLPSFYHPVFISCEILQT